MKRLSIILICFLVTLASCTKSKEVHPEIGDGNDEIVTVGMKDVHVEYTRTDHAELNRVVFHYSLAEVQQFEAAEMAKRETFFELTLDDLLCNALYSYYYELFYNGGETSTTERKTFRTQACDTPTPPTPPSGVPEGAVNGLFTINANGDQVYFSQGNLQYQASTNTWRFAENQWNFVGTQAPYGVTYCCGNVNGSDNANISSTYSGWIDLFGWGTSGYNHGSVCYQPWSTSENNSDYYAYGSYTNNLNNQTGIADWGYNPISNGGNQVDLWRTMSKEEWNYVIDSRQTSSGILYAKSVVNCVRGVVLLPDNWDVSVYALIGANQGSTSFSTNTISLSDWNNMEANGAVFLPVTGMRCEGIVIGYYEVNGDYWSSTVIDSDNASRLMFDNNYVGTGIWPQQRFNGRSVRLVQDAK